MIDDIRSAEKLTAFEGGNPPGTLGSCWCSCNCYPYCQQPSWTTSMRDWRWQEIGSTNYYG